MKIKIVLINLILIIALFVIGDIIFSNFIYTSNVGHKCYKIAEDGKFYKLKKNCYAKMRRISSIDSFKVYTDSKGNRFSGEKKSFSEKNLYFIGDSHTFGLGSNWENTFVGIVESKKSNYKITNLAVPSYSPTVFYYQLQKLNKNKEIDSDKVFALIDITDVADESIRWRSDPDVLRPYLNTSIIEKKSGFKKFKRKNLKGSHIIATFLREKGRKLRKELNHKNSNENIKKRSNEVGTWPGRFTFTKFSELEECESDNKTNNPWSCGGVNLGLNKIAKKMEKFGQLIKENNSELYLIIFPWPETLNFGQNIFNWEKYIYEVCKISNCKKVINLFPDFQDIKDSNEAWLKDLYLPGDFHLTAKGNKLIADKILREAF